MAIGNLHSDQHEAPKSKARHFGTTFMHGIFGIGFLSLAVAGSFPKQFAAIFGVDFRGWVPVAVAATGAALGAALAAFAKPRR